MSAVAAIPERPLRIGEVARVVGTTPRTIRYYEEIGLLSEAASRPSGQHRLYTEADVERLREIVRLRDVLGLTLDELKELVEHEDARAALRAEWRRGAPDTTRRRQYLPPRSYQVIPTPGSAGMSTSRGSALRGGSDAASGIRASPVAMLRRYL